jgi:hypothetical protein
VPVLVPLPAGDRHDHSLAEQRSARKRAQLDNRTASLQLGPQRP